MELAKALRDMEVPEAKANILANFNSVVAEQMNKRTGKATFKNKKEFEDFMNICLRSYK